MATDTMVKTRFTPMLLQGTAHAPGYDAKVGKGNGSNGRSTAAPSAKKGAKKATGSGLRACPFCRELFTDDETETCPECGLAVRDLADLPPSPDAEELAAEEGGHGLAVPHTEPLPWRHLGRGRAILLVCAVVLLIAFYLPWAMQTSPETTTWTGAELAKVVRFYWSSFTASLVLFPAVLSRRSIHKMIGARAAVVCLSAIPAMQCLMMMRRPTHVIVRGIAFDYHWGPGFYLTIATSIVATVVAFRFGGKLDDVTVTKGTSRGEILH